MAHTEKFIQNSNCIYARDNGEWEDNKLNVERKKINKLSCK